MNKFFRFNINKNELQLEVQDSDLGVLKSRIRTKAVRILNTELRIIGTGIDNFYCICFLIFLY
jgi:hypothetical protein